MRQYACCSRSEEVAISALGWGKMSQRSNENSADEPQETSSERRSINCRVSVDAYDAWREFCEANGVSLTAVLEAIAFEMRQLLQDREMAPVETAIVDHARRIDAERRARRPRPRG